VGWSVPTNGFVTRLVRALDAGDHADDQQSHDDDDQRSQPASLRSSPASLPTADEGIRASVASPQIEILSPGH
jgi:hypothetical protein